MYQERLEGIKSLGEEVDAHVKKVANTKSKLQEYEETYGVKFPELIRKAYRMT